MEPGRTDAPAAPSRQGCGIVLLVVVASLWIVLLCGVDLFASWILEQTLFESSVGISDIRWLLHLVCTALTFVPTLILSLVVKNPRTKLIFRLWMLASVFGFLTVPMKTLYLTAQNETAIIQLSSMALFLVAMIVFKKPSEPGAKSETKPLPRSGNLGIAIALAMAVLIPFLLWGALGSALDTILEVLVGVVFGILVVKLAYPFYLEKVHTTEREIRVSDFILDGFVLFVFLLVLAAALAHNGSQTVLVIGVPVSAWALAAFSITNIGKRNRGRLQVGIIAAVSLAAPLLFFDMDELSLVIGSGDGEVMSWALKASWFAFMTLLTVFIVLLINFKFAYNTHFPKKWEIGLIGVSILSIVFVYLVWGQVGFHGDKIFVILNDQADLTGEAQITDYAERRQAVYSKLVTFASESQNEIRAALDKYALGYTPYYLVNGLEVDGGWFARLALAKEDSIDRILDDPQLRPLPQAASLGEAGTMTAPESPAWNIVMINADKAVKEFGVTGQGIIIGQTDSGVDGRHAQLEQSYRGFSARDDYNWLDPWNQSPFPVDLGGHGTMTLGIITGKDIGIAPDAQWIGCVNLARNLGNPAKYLDCMQFMLAPYPQSGNAFTDGDPSLGAMVVNNSWGCPTVEGCDAEVYQGAMDALATAGIFMSSAAGNTGNYGCSTVTDPISIYASVFTAGSVNKDGNLSSFSSVGPVLVDGSNRQKPDVLAPGEQVTSSYPGGGYMTADGTSFAAPHVSGVVALMWSANPALIGNVDATMQILRQSASKYQGSAPICGDIESAVGAGILDAYAAVNAAQLWK